MIAFEKLTTSRLTIKALTEQDAVFLLTLMGTKEWKAFIGDRNITTKQAAITSIEKIKNTADFYYWVVFEKETSTPIGVISFIKRTYLTEFDIGFAFLPAFMGVGYAKEAVKSLMEEIEISTSQKEIISITLPHNERAIRLLRALGFSFVRIIKVEDEVLALYHYVL